jgi:hypothetical protein
VSTGTHVEVGEERDSDAVSQADGIVMVGGNDGVSYNEHGFVIGIGHDVTIEFDVRVALDVMIGFDEKIDRDKMVGVDAVGEVDAWMQVPSYVEFVVDSGSVVILVGVTLIVREIVVEVGA